MNWFRLIRILIRLLTLFIQQLRAGNPYAIGALALLVGSIIVAGFVKFARRPLGGDPEKPPLGDDDFRDDKNPYLNFSSTPISTEDIQGPPR